MAHTAGKTQTFAIYTIIWDGSQRGNVCKHAHSCRSQSVCDVRHYHIRCGKTKCVWLSTYHTRFIIMNYLWCARHHKTPVPGICLENSHAWNLPGFRQNHKTPTAMAMRAQTSSKDEAFGIFEISERLYRDNSMHQGSLSPMVSGSCGKDHPIAHTHLATVPNAVVKRG